MNALKPQVHLEVLKEGPTSYKDSINKCLILEGCEVQVGVKNIKSTTTSGSKNKHATSDAVIDSRSPSLSVQLLDPITSAIKKIERTIVNASKNGTPANKSQAKNPPSLKGETKTIHMTEKGAKQFQKDSKTTNKTPG